METKFIKVLFNSDMINDENHIYFGLDGNYFELLRYSINESDLLISIIKAYHSYQTEYAESPKTMFISFVPYNNFIIKDKPEHENIFGLVCLKEMLSKLGISIGNIHVMIPDRMKDKFAATK